MCCKITVRPVIDEEKVHYFEEKEWNKNGKTFIHIRISYRGTSG